VLTAAYRAYDWQELDRITAVGLDAEETRCLRDAYATTTSKRGGWLRQALFENARTEESPCPLCELGNVSQLDHYLDQASFPEFCVYPPNLVPSCKDCNPNVKRVKNGVRNVLHCYRDPPEELASALSAVLKDASGGAAQPRFEVQFSAPAGSLLERHLDTLGIRDRYRVAASAEVHTMIDHLRVVVQLAGPPGAISLASLEVRAHNWAKSAETNVRLSHFWRIAVRRAVARSPAALAYVLRSA